ncbi:unnamed protein product [Diabrotica balteata]|uniref:Reverse transcriptase n=1 Tax=Diabrotica balteata TaxID=107213 RepID=A0A9N9XAH3_DIABA|nr:unnamed protein product [Diabrotica balteata]
MLMTLKNASNQEEMENMRCLEEKSKTYGLKLNRSKTKIKIVDRAQKNLHYIKEIGGFEVVNSFIYLESLITNDGGCDREIRRRLTIAITAMMKLVTVSKNSSLTRHTKLRLVRALIFPIATYASETWTLKKADKNKLDAFEM